MTAQATRARGQAMSEANMPDTCQVISGRTRGPLNQESGEYELGEENYSYEGPCRITGVTAQPTDIESVGQVLVSQDAAVAFPLSLSAAVEEGHTLRITASDSDPARSGIEVRVAGPAQLRSFPVDRRFRLEETV